MAVLTGCSGEEEKGQRSQSLPKLDVSLTGVDVRNLPVFIEASGSLLADETVTLSAKVAGRVVEVTRDLGDVVEPGQALVKIDPTDYRLMLQEKTYAMNQALAQLGLSEMPQGEVDTTKLPTVQRAASEQKNARTRLDRLARLHEQKLVSDQDFNDAQTAAEVASSEYDVAVLNAQAILAEARTRQSELASAKQRLMDTTIAAPAADNVQGQAPKAGADRYIVAQRMVSQGEYVSEGTPLFRLVDDNPIRLRMAVPERHVGQVKLKQPVRVSVQAFAQPFEGQVTRISPEVNAANRTFLVEVSIANEEGRLKPGSFAMGAIEVKSDQPTLLIPKAAVATFAGVSKVFEVHEGKTREVQVRLGQEHDQLVEVREGLTPDSRIIHPLPARTVTGQPVSVVERSAETPAVP